MARGRAGWWPLLLIAASLASGCALEFRGTFAKANYDPGGRTFNDEVKPLGVGYVLILGAAWDHEYAHRTVISGGVSGEISIAKTATDGLVANAGGAVGVRGLRALDRKRRIVATVRAAALWQHLEYADAAGHSIYAGGGFGYDTTAGLGWATHQEQFGLSVIGILEGGYRSLTTDDAGSLSGPLLSAGMHVVWMPKSWRHQQAPSRRATQAYQGFHERSEDDHITALKIAALDLGCQLTDTSRQQLVASCAGLEVRVRRAGDGVDVACAQGRLPECRAAYTRLTAAAPDLR